jgi:hypothetical protein
VIPLSGLIVRVLCEKAKDFLEPNAGRQARLEAEAMEERTL